MLILGVSGSLFLPIIRFIYKGLIITNIDGIEWKRAKWGKLARWVLRTSEKIAVRYSDVLIGDNQAIIKYVRKEYNKPAELIEYGADQCERNSDDISFKMIPYEKYALSVCRIEPENNVDVILEAFKRFSDFPLVFIGNWNSCLYGQKLLEKYKYITNILLLDPIYDLSKLNSIRMNAMVYIHGHSAGGTNPSLVEAMYFALPIFAYDCVYNIETTENECKYWTTAKDLIDLISNITKINMIDIGQKMKSIADKRYSWNIIVGKYERLFYIKPDKKRTHNRYVQ